MSKTRILDATIAVLSNPRTKKAATERTVVVHYTETTGEYLVQVGSKVVDTGTNTRAHATAIAEEKATRLTTLLGKPYTVVVY